MDHRNRAYDRNIRFGCGFLALLAIAGVIISLALAVNQTRRSTRYPGATFLSRQNIYSPPSYTVLWDDTYLSTDSMWQIYRWYSTHFNLRLDLASHTMRENCLLLYGSKKIFVVERRMSVTLCETPTGQTISVTRATAVD